MLSEGSLSFTDVTNSVKELTFMNWFAVQKDTTSSKTVTTTSGKCPASQDTSSNQTKWANNGAKVVKNESAQIIKIILPLRFIYAASKKLLQLGTKCMTHNGSEVCLKWFIKGSCDSNCPQNNTHCIIADVFVV